MKMTLMALVLCFTQMIHSAGKNRPARGQVGLNEQFERLTPKQREELALKYQAKECVNKTGLQVSCGFRTEWTGGDKTYNWDPYMNKIPQGTRVEIDIKCDPRQGKFFMDVKIPTKVCKRKSNGKIDQRSCVVRTKYLNNPYDGDGVDSVLTDQPTRWKASPGLWPDSRTDEHPKGIGKRTIGGRAVVSEYHVVSPNQPWAGAQMLYALWIKGGYAVHGSNSVDGYPGSGGCIRLDQLNAFALFNVARRVGPNNMIYNWHGYGDTNPTTGKPYCAGPPGHREKILAERKLISPEENAQALKELEEALWRRNAAEGRVRVAQEDLNDDPVRSTDSVKEQ